MREVIACNTFLKKKGPFGEAALNIKGVITCSVGVASLAGCADRRGSARQTAEALIRSADSAMYKAKDLGKNRVCIAGAGES